MTLITNLSTAHTSQTPVSTSADQSHPRRSAVSIAQFARPADTTAYVAGDVVSDDSGTAKAIEFPGCARVNGGGGALVRATMNYEELDTVNFELLLFDEEPTNHADNAALALVTGDMVKLSSVVKLGNTTKVQLSAGAAHYRGSDAVENGDRPYVCESTSTSLYGLLVTRSAYTPSSAAKITIRLHLLLD